MKKWGFVEGGDGKATDKTLVHRRGLTCGSLGVLQIRLFHEGICFLPCLQGTRFGPVGMGWQTALLSECEHTTELFAM